MLIHQVNNQSLLRLTNDLLVQHIVNDYLKKSSIRSWNVTLSEKVVAVLRATHHYPLLKKIKKIEVLIWVI